MLSCRKYEDVQLVVIGSTRHEEDRQLLLGLRREAHRLQLNKDSEPGPGDGVVFVVNQSYDELERWMAKALVGLHSMWNEHFGISVVEMLAAGLLVVAHRSGGPLMDIITHGHNGYLAESAEEYADCLSRVLDHYDDQEAVRQRGRDSTGRFSDEMFMQAIVPEILRLC